MFFSHAFSKLQEALIYFGMPAVTFYHLLFSNLFLNTAAEDAKGLERAGDIFLSPYRYLFAGKVAFLTDAEYKYDFRQNYTYNEQLLITTGGAMISLPFSLTIGGVLKGCALLFEDVRERHRTLQKALYASYVISNREYYRSLGIDLDESKISEKLCSKGYLRRPEDKRHLSEEKKAFFEILRLLKEKQIPFWADCGTCLGAYRYAGTIPWDNDFDVAILEPDFCNMKRALNGLDPSLYIVEDWSNRLFPNTYVRVYIRSTRQYIDVYTYAIDAKVKSIRYICSNEHNMFMLEGWKINERRYTVPTPFDVVFPLRLADFDGIEIPVPNQTEKYLQMRYGENLSPAKIFNVETGFYEKDLSHPYWQRAYAH
jgi:hypothetical protein